MNNHHALSAYGQTNAHSAVMDASPHKLIALLFGNAQTRLRTAIGHVERNQRAEAGQVIGKVIDIVSELQACLDREHGYQVADTLFNVYSYMNRRLIEANAKQDVAALEDVARLLNELKSGWDGIASQVEG